MSTPIPPNNPGDRTSPVNKASSSSKQAPEKVNVQPQRTEAQSLIKTDSQVWQDIDLSKIDTISSVKLVHSKSVNPGAALPKTVSVREFEIGNEKASIQIAENIGATPVQIRTADGVDLLWSPIASDNYNNQLNGAGSVGGIPIVGPAGRTAYGKENKPEIHLAGAKHVEFDKKDLGPNGRIAVDSNGLASHGPIFTSNKWKLTSAKTKEDGLQVTYTLPIHQKDSDKLVDKLVDNEVAISGSAGLEDHAKPAEMTATYRVTLDASGEPKFNSEIRIKLGSKDMMLLGSIAQHTFLASKKGDKLQTNAKSEYEAPIESPELPTGKIIPIQKQNDFSNPRVIHKDSANPLEVVLTGYSKAPQAVLERTDGYRVVSRAGGDYNGFLLCNKGTDNLMLEPIAGHPNATNVESKFAVLPIGEKLARFDYELYVTN